ncbi:type II secretion system protein C (GspC) [Desulfuromusa kysingii]|uniref:Type II secretion system protein C (GspC) n=1 Tax=Desulfuromusa kysingii TaxID=37625 RepID=A0A1H3W2D0_9BACT|nr:type II secretion system protein GspC [Desulfuromusa kysingii]SDZ81257.1 type II secretion system protein C (GspC) [Desulfuromusa kysingii]
MGLAAVQIDLQRLLNYLLLLLSVVGGIISGMLVTRLLDLSLGGATMAPVSSVSRQVRAPQLQEDDFQIILDRNLFNSAATGTAETMSLSSTVIAAETDEAAAGAVTDLILIGTVVAGDESLALIQSGPKAAIFQLNAELAPGLVVSQIGRKLVVLMDHGVPRELLLKPRKGAKAQLVKKSDSVATQQGVVALDGSRWQVSKAVANNARANLNSLLQTARMIPEINNGKTVGFKLIAIDKGSLLEQIGLRVGDLIVEINQVKLNSPEKALQIFQQVREANNISLGLVRNGKPETFEYSFE